MVEPSSFYARLADREGFNTSVRHINRTLELLDLCTPKTNIADEVNRLLVEKELDSAEVQSAINMLLVEKWKYSVVSRNISGITDSPADLVAETATWKAVDLVIGYHHPDLGFIVINPKNPESAAIISGFRKNELVVFYAGTLGDGKGDVKTNFVALENLAGLLEGKKAKVPASLLSGAFVFIPPKKESVKRTAGEGSKKSARGTAPSSAARTSRPSVRPAMSTTIYTGPAASTPVAAAPQPVQAPAPVAVPGSSKMSPLISVVVSNELFHNGNVEAWKRIIRSYNAKYPALQVFIYYDGERIVDINTLFKWGKVKHGSCIQFSVAGENIQDLAKLSRYFRQGASPQFEAFLHGSPDTVMNLF
jgi:hypothetical protein